MNRSRPAIVIVSALAMCFVVACSGEKPIDVKAITAQPKLYVGSDTCKMCHLEHFDSWKMTLHSRMLQDAQKNKDAIIVELDEKQIREDLSKISGLKVPADKIWIPKVEDVKYTIGSQW
ncbi:MAG: putative cytochrome c family protein, partial [Deltaproteobacteria bacterium]|nr:putative cytochrome c family protein [Deltaproteobacteria bacterium]